MSTDGATDKRIVRDKSDYPLCRRQSVDTKGERGGLAMGVQRGVGALGRAVGVRTLVSEAGGVGWILCGPDLAQRHAVRLTGETTNI